MTSPRRRAPAPQASSPRRQARARLSPLSRASGETRLVGPPGAINEHSPTAASICRRTGPVPTTSARRAYDQCSSSDAYAPQAVEDEVESERERALVVGFVLARVLEQVGVVAGSDLPSRV